MCLFRLATSPAIVLTSKYGWSANMERIMKAQALSDGQQQSYMKGMKTLEVNPHHPLIQQLKAQACPRPTCPSYGSGLGHRRCTRIVSRAGTAHIVESLQCS